MSERGPPPVTPYWHLWTDADGTSRQTHCKLERFEQKSMGGAAAQWNDAMARGEATVLFAVLPVGWAGDWHENPAPQWIVPLTGRWFVESMHGQRVELGPGEVSLGEDQRCKPDAQGRRGHRSGTVGDAPAHLMIVQLHTRSLPRPCHHR